MALVAVRRAIRVRSMGGITLAVTLAAVAVAGCTGGRPATPGSGRVTLRVLASTSLTEIMSQLGQAYETAHPALHVQIIVGSDFALAAKAGAQIPGQTPRQTPSGASAAEPADLLVAEGLQPFEALGARVSGAAVPVARNQLVIAVAPGNPRRITRLADLSKPGVRVAICGPQEPCGVVTATTLAHAGIHLPGATQVPDVRAARDLVERGSADAALVYRTDTREAADRVDTAEFSESVQAVITYQAAALTGSAHATAAQAFLAFLTSPLAGSLLTQSGFQAV